MVYLYKYMYEYVGPGTRATEGLGLDQVLSCLRDNSSWGPPLGALYPGGSLACSTLTTLPGSASVVLASGRGGLRKYHYVEFFAVPKRQVNAEPYVWKDKVHFWTKRQLQA